MKVLQRFERWVNQVLEGGLAGLLGARIQPVDIARRLAEHMDDHRTIGAGQVYVPNRFRVFLAPTTLAGFAAFQKGLEDELAAYLGACGRESGLSFVGRVRVGLLADPELRPGRLRIESDLVDRSGVVLGDGGQRTEALHVPAPTGGQPAPPAVTLAIGPRGVRLAEARVVTLGRALDNDVIVDDGSVSRHHARLVPRGDHWMIEDLDSAHGTFVNGHRTTSSLLRPGDRLQIGRVAARLEPPEAAG